METTLQCKLRKAIGAVKDHTSISIVKVGNAASPEVEIALLKTTSHDEAPFEEKYVQELLYLTSCVRDQVDTCIASLAKRLRKTRNWIVAVKTLMLAHRLLRDGNPAFEHDLASARKKGTRVLNVCAFRDEYHSHSWDFSAFVRAYGMYLDERLECSVPSFSPSKPQDPSTNRLRCEEVSACPSASAGDDDRSRGKQQCAHKRRKPVKKMRPQELMQKFPLFQRLLERILACRPSGAAKANRLVLFTLQPILRESFLVYSDIRDGMAILLDAFFDLDQRDCRSAFNMYSKAAKQVDELISLYTFCKSLGVCKTTEYPAVEKISQDMLEAMESSLQLRIESVRDSSTKSKPSQARSVSFQDDLEGHPASESKGIKNSSASSCSSRPPIPIRITVPPKPLPISKHGVSCLSSNESSTRNSRPVQVDDTLISSFHERENKLALVLFSDSTGADTSQGDIFPIVADNGNALPNNVSQGTTEPLMGWELALIDSNSDASRMSDCAPVGGFDQLLLDSLRDHGMSNQRSQISFFDPAESARSVMAPSHPDFNLLSVPALSPLQSTFEAQEMEDPFAASLHVPPPQYVQMSESSKKEHLLLQDQQQWLQYQQGTSSCYGATPTIFSPNPFASPFQSTAMPISYYGVNSNCV